MYPHWGLTGLTNQCGGQSTQEISMWVTCAHGEGLDCVVGPLQHYEKMVSLHLIDWFSPGILTLLHICVVSVTVIHPDSNLPNLHSTTEDRLLHCCHSGTASSSYITYCLSTIEMILLWSIHTSNIVERGLFFISFCRSQWFLCIVVYACVVLLADSLPVMTTLSDF